ncbi:MAG TPA: DUF1648 domain-containing protein [Candidatus Baltobacteraceae bacterium]|nr:DUF1648 domain-containing protein [Candidatus Baltobacteraceae bacterium]
MLVSFLAATAAAIVVMTVVHTVAEYPNLPDRVPLNIGATGVVNTWGPRFAIWFLPAVAIVTAGIMLFGGYAIAAGSRGAHGSVPGAAFFAACILAVVARAQWLLISVAKSGGNRVPMTGFWLFFAVMLGAASLGALFL